MDRAVGFLKISSFRNPSQLDAMHYTPTMALQIPFTARL